MIPLIAKIEGLRQPLKKMALNSSGKVAPFGQVAEHRGAILLAPSKLILVII
jgi:hypothetical protein